MQPCGSTPLCAPPLSAAAPWEGWSHSSTKDLPKDQNARPVELSNIEYCGTCKFESAFALLAIVVNVSSHSYILAMQATISPQEQQRIVVNALVEFIGRRVASFEPSTASTLL